MVMQGLHTHHMTDPIKLNISLHTTSAHCILLYKASSLQLSGLGHSACWPEGLRALVGLSSTPGLEGSFSAQ